MDGGEVTPEVGVMGSEVLVNKRTKKMMGPWGAADGVQGPMGVLGTQGHPGQGQDPPGDADTGGETRSPLAPPTGWRGEGGAPRPAFSDWPDGPD